MLKTLANFITINILHISANTKQAEVVSYFFYDVIKILLLLVVMIFAVSLLRTFFPKEKIRALLARRHPFWGHLSAGLLGTITPFCSCSAVPLFLGFVEVGVPLGATFTFLIASPMVNEIALAMLFGLFGFKIALLYAVSGLAVAIVAGYFIGKINPETLLEKSDVDSQVKENSVFQTWPNRLRYARDYTYKIFSKIWLYVILGVGAGAYIHGYVPVGFLGQYAHSWFSVPLAVVVGIPLYSNAAGVIPLISALVEKGVGMGTALALLMSVTALSLPEFMILKKVMKIKTLAIFAGVMFVGISLVGLLFNFVI